MPNGLLLDSMADSALAGMCTLEFLFVLPLTSVAVELDSLWMMMHVDKFCWITGYDARFPQQNQYVPAQMLFFFSPYEGRNPSLTIAPPAGPSTAGRTTLTTISVSMPRAKTSAHVVRYLAATPLLIFMKLFSIFRYLGRIAKRYGPFV